MESEVSLRDILKELLNVKQLLMRSLCKSNHRTAISDTENVNSITKDNVEIYAKRIIDSLVWESTLSDTAVKINEMFPSESGKELFLRKAVESVIGRNSRYRRYLGELIGRLLVDNLLSNDNIVNSIVPILISIEEEPISYEKYCTSVREILSSVASQGSSALINQIREKAESILSEDNFDTFDEDVIEHLKHGTGFDEGDGKSLDDEKTVIPSDEKKSCKKKQPYNRCSDRANIVSNVDSFVHRLNANPSGNLTDELNAARNGSDVRLFIRVLMVRLFKQSRPAPGVHRTVGKLLANCTNERILSKLSLLFVIGDLLKELNPSLVVRRSRATICDRLSELLKPVFKAGLIDFGEIRELISINISNGRHVEHIENHLEAVFREREIPNNPNDGPLVTPSFSVRLLASNKSDIDSGKKNGGNLIAIDRISRPTFPPEAERSIECKPSSGPAAMEADSNRHDSVTGPAENANDSIVEPVEAPPEREPESMPPLAINETVNEILNGLQMSKYDLDAAVGMMRVKFNRCQLDTVLNAIFQYTRNRRKQFRLAIGYLIAELSDRYENVKIRNNVMNAVSFTLGDYTDCPQFWESITDILAPIIVREKLSIGDLVYLPRYVLHTPACTSFVTALFRTIIDQTDPNYLQTLWRSSEMSVDQLLPSEDAKRFLTFYPFCS